MQATSSSTSNGGGGTEDAPKTDEALSSSSSSSSSWFGGIFSSASNKDTDGAGGSKSTVTSTTESLSESSSSSINSSSSSSISKKGLLSTISSAILNRVARDVDPFDDAGALTAAEIEDLRNKQRSQLTTTTSTMVKPVTRTVPAYIPPMCLPPNCKRPKLSLRRYRTAFALCRKKRTYKSARSGLCRSSDRATRLPVSIPALPTCWN